MFFIHSTRITLALLSPGRAKADVW